MSKKQNILLITTDQQRFDTIAALGNDFIYTPHLDWLVDEGITFSRCYSSAPICMPARATIMCGREGYNMKYTGNSKEDYPLEKYQTLPHILGCNGYQTRAQGKMHFEPMRKNYGFDHMELPMDYYREMNRINKGSGLVSGLPKAHGVGENEMEPVLSTVNEIDSLTHWTVRRSVDFLETRDTSRPFFMWTSFTKPHPPFDPCDSYWQLYAHREMPAPVEGDWDLQKEGFMEPTYCLNHAYKMSQEKLKETKKAYYACISQIDYNLGILFSRLREMDLLENTWIIFTADHGEMLGDHRMGGKTIHLEGSSHVPCLIRPPKRPWDIDPMSGTKCDKLVQLSDIYATILSIGGAAVPDSCDGVNLLDYVKNDDKRIFYGMSVDNFYCVIENQYKYMWTRNGGEELLFDLENDPNENKDLIDSRTHANLVKEMREKLRDFVHKHAPELIIDGELTADKEALPVNKVNKWPGFHSTVEDSDVLH